MGKKTSAELIMQVELHPTSHSCRSVKIEWRKTRLTTKPKPNTDFRPKPIRSVYNCNVAESFGFSFEQQIKPNHKL